MFKIEKDKTKLTIFSPKKKSGVFPNCSTNVDVQIMETSISV